MKTLPTVMEWPTGRLDFSGGCLVMGILNVTPDSFSDGGQFLDIDKAVARGVQMVQQGAAIIDVGPESTRPGAQPVSVDEQIRRAIPVIERLRRQVDVPISIDTRNAAVAEAALDAGGSIINDITALEDHQMACLISRRGVPVILMHMQGTPETMQDAPHYDDVVAEVLEYLMERAKYAETLGIHAHRIILDPGIGFGKTADHNLRLLKRLELFGGLGYRVMLAASRKRFISQIVGKEAIADRIYGTAAAIALGVMKGVSIVRVHDVAEMADVVKIVRAVQNAEA